MLLEVSGLTTRYGSIAALRDASLSVGAGEVVGLIGPNGAGKTTLLVVEQNAARMLEVADRAYVLRSGAVVAHGLGEEVLARVDLFDTFVRGSAP